ncbi:GNAT family N-acetyltransferase [Xenorhabdus sp. 12]|uniref:GNAT family N-acetyltransferase n=1 Tax=Xenorhabdus santafensis TaxID=2582833 RepID=A0ABU4SBT9_9GAMM|nr:GNAT family N-acetyltransferase [Xenorhabdus sp. 12]MDX7988281.1 GNAT family N-acetyltransferase [Xenorhabdus sp. 12]
MVIRTASTQDIEAILSLYSVLFTEMSAMQPDRIQAAEQDRDFVISSINDDEYHLLVAEDENGEIKGFAIAQEQKSQPYNALVSRSYGYVIDLIVSRESRSLGIGQKLLAGMKEWAQKNNYSHLELTVLSKNTKAIQFYEREGYQDVSKVMSISL